MRPQPSKQTKIRRRIVVIATLMGLWAAGDLPTRGYAGTSYYIDFDSGNDSNSGTSSSTPWKTIPGTRNAPDTADQSTSWGLPANPAFNSSRPVPAGTIFKLKSGTTHNGSNGGRINISSTYYATNATPSNPILLQRDPTWGSGSTVFDGTGITLSSSSKSDSGWGLIHINSNIGGISFDGSSGVTADYDGIIVQNSPKIGISYYASSPNVMAGGTVRYVKFSNNGTLHTTNDASFAGSGQLYFANHNGVTIDHVEFDGNGKYTNGLHLGQSSTRVTNAVVSNSIAHDHKGSDETDVGIGFKAQNSQVKYMNDISYGNDKGWDSGEEDADSSWDISYKLVNSYSYSNATLGAGFSVSSAARTGTAKFYVVNSIFRDNTGPGVKMYAGPYDAYITGNVFDNNDYQMLVHCDGPTDTQVIRVYYYNNIFYKSSSSGAWGAAYWYDSGHDVQYSGDYNSYVQTSSENAVEFGAYGNGSDWYGFAFGEGGPGHASGTWYDFKSWRNDANSKGTGATVTTMPPFRNVGGHDYSLTSQYPGVNISSMPWYVPEMGTDKGGNPRNSWDIGPYEYAGAGDSTPPAPPARLRVR
jgi:hypothetical protein